MGGAVVAVVKAVDVDVFSWVSGPHAATARMSTTGTAVHFHFLGMLHLGPSDGMTTEQSQPFTHKARKRTVVVKITNHREGPEVKITETISTDRP
jgi:hypothetical protein